MLTLNNNHFILEMFATCLNVASIHMHVISTLMNVVNFVSALWKKIGLDLTLFLFLLIFHLKFNELI